MDCGLKFLQDFYFTTFTYLVDYLIEPTKKKLDMAYDVAKSNFEASAKLRGAISRLSRDPDVINIVIFVRQFLGLTVDVLQKLEREPDLIKDRKFRDSWINSLKKLVEVCKVSHDLYGVPYLFYRSLLLCLVYILDKYKVGE